jgi:uncharacterized protein YgiM (DUF1202 family)
MVNHQYCKPQTKGVGFFSHPAEDYSSAIRLNQGCSKPIVKGELLMNLFKKLPLTVLFLLCIAPMIALAAQDCPAIVQQALTATDAACVGIGRNQACYGNVQLDAVPQAGIEAFNFSQPGDLVDVASVQSLKLSSMNEAVQEWGVALMKIQANLPETLPGQNVTFLLFGDVELQNAAPSNVDPVTFSITANNNVNVRSGPSTNDGVVATLAGGESVTADGRNPDSTWLRVQLEDGTPGWVFAELVAVDGDISTLTLVDPLALIPPPSSIQAFYFKSGAGDSPCAEAPNGLLIQSPADAERVQLTINGANLTIGSTVFLQTPEGNADEMVVSTLAGLVQIEADGVQQTVIQGAEVSVPLDENGDASGAPSAPQPYDADFLMPVASSIIQGQNLFVHLEDDRSPLLDQLIAECGLTALTADESVTVLTADELQTLTECVVEFLASQVTLPTAGWWRPARFTNVFTGECLSGPVADGDGGGGAELPTIPVYGIKLPGKRAYLIVQTQAYPHVEGTTDRFGGDRAPYYEAKRDDNFQTIGTIETVYSDDYQVLAPDRILVTISSQETGGCSSTGSYEMTLITADDSVIDENAAAETIEQYEMYATPQPVADINDGLYDVSFGDPVGTCDETLGPPDIDTMQVTPNGDDSITLETDTVSYTVYREGRNSYQYDAGRGEPHIQVSLNVSEDGLSFSWLANDNEGGLCLINADLTFTGT